VKHKGKPRSWFQGACRRRRETALVEEVAITPANVNDGRPVQPLFRMSRGGVRRQRFGDNIFAMPSMRRAASRASSPPPCGARRTETLARLDAWNQPLHRVRGRIEKIFGTWKRCYGLRRMRWRGLAKASIQVRLTAIAYNLKRTLNIVAAAAA